MLPALAFLPGCVHVDPFSYTSVYIDFVSGWAEQQTNFVIEFIWDLKKIAEKHLIKYSF